MFRDIVHVSKHTAEIALTKGPDDWLTLETSAFKLFTVANLRYQLNW